MRRGSQLLMQGSYEEALQRLLRLQSNAAAMQAWTEERLAKKTVDLRAETMHHLRVLGVRVEQLSVIHVAGTKHVCLTRRAVRG